MCGLCEKGTASGWWRLEKKQKQKTSELPEESWYKPASLPNEVVASLCSSDL